MIRSCVVMREVMARRRSVWSLLECILSDNVMLKD